MSLPSRNVRCVDGTPDVVHRYIRGRERRAVGGGRMECPGEVVAFAKVDQALNLDPRDRTSLKRPHPDSLSSDDHLVKQP